MITDLQKDLESYKEISRILLRENIDLKDYLEEKKLLPEEDMVDLDELFSCFSEAEDEDYEEVDGDEESIST